MRATHNGRALGADPEAFSGGVLSRSSCRPKADCRASSARGGDADSQHRRAVAHASAVLPQLQDGASSHSAVVTERGHLRSAHRPDQHSSRAGRSGRVGVLHRRKLCLGEGRSGAAAPLRAALDRRALLAWIQWQRRLLVRWEYYLRNFLGFAQLAVLCILLKQF